MNLHDELKKAEEAESKQEPIHSEVEAVKQQMEDHKVSWLSCDIQIYSLFMPMRDVWGLQ